MVNVDKAVIARLKAEGSNFEILVDCASALALKEGKTVDMHDVLAAMQIFSDAHKGLVASEHAIKQIFGTNDVGEVASQIIHKGEIQLTQEYRENLREEKRKQIVALHLTKIINLWLFIFNMLPIPPLDGSKVFYHLFQTIF